LIVELVTDRLVAGIHDVADGGVATALTEMAVRSGIGFEVDGLTTPMDLFGEAPSRVVVCVERDLVSAVEERAGRAGITAAALGRSGGQRLAIDGMIDLDLSAATQAWRGALPHALAVSEPVSA
jgi:phosphoribosylformylglycinamidine synthase